ncbi:tRNA-dihydrouridine(20a/20b) synthase [NAD(P)+]-like isoform X3 [Narcine bancroftii]|uniref:tRNA-dihydrouridine(20a/20b) synthase [NAD(P)+]-like isoform X3 n=2 Tax=Narcine bancroftii TaxID=1343680 RepID=UPI0038312A8B
MNGEHPSSHQRQQRCLVDMFRPGHVVKICAPMVRYSKLAFRSLVRRYDCDLCFTPMIIASAFLKSGKARDSEFTTNFGDRPLVVQFAANCSHDLADAACLVSPFADGVDLNCGCPQRWAMAEGYGACLINKPELVQDMVRCVRNQVECPGFSVSIKIRLHKDLRRTVDLCQKVEAAGISWLTVHGRETEERHQPVHYDAIKIIKENLTIPVVANGDVRSNKDVDHVRQLTGIDGIKSTMTLQWVAVVAFLYAEVGFILLLCLPFISPRRWLKVFTFRIWEKLSSFWSRAFLTIIVVLVILFFDAIREVRKYSVNREIGKDEKLLPNVHDNLNMKLFRAQRNLYISGFSLFLWLVLRRMVTLVSELAIAMGENQALKVQTDNANNAAKRYLEENEELRKAFNQDKGDGNKKLEMGNEQLIEEMEKMKAELKRTTEALEKSKMEIISIQKQHDGLTREYDRLLQEHDKLQNRTDKSDKKTE